MSNKVSDDSTYTSALYSIWSIQDSLLQSYRVAFLTSESLLLGIASTVAHPSDDGGSPSLLVSWMLILVGLILLCIWGFVTQARARNVRFVQELLSQNEKGKRVQNPFSTMKAYQKSWLKSGKYSIEYMDQAEAEPFIPPRIWPPRDIPLYKFWDWGARIHMEITIPATYGLGWMLVILLVLGVDLTEIFCG